MTAWRARLARDDGQVVVLVIGAAVLAIAITVTLAAVSGLMLERKRLVSLADNAAAFAAADVNARDVYDGMTPDGLTVPALTTRGATASVEAYVAETSLMADDVELVGVVADDTSVTVTLRTTVRPWLVGAFADLLGGEGIVVEGEGRARQRTDP
ncbi:hypothetical protein ACTVCO_07055 [Sanguibacter sp. A247]|uniref:hypothetical protein n=1 Tax=unclassified Sanguibacter TaxID=2645534 RepID=UPI003FD8128A